MKSSTNNFNNLINLLLSVFAKISENLNPIPSANSLASSSETSSFINKFSLFL